jgi:hypothetical protein
MSVDEVILKQVIPTLRGVDESPTGRVSAVLLGDYSIHEIGVLLTNRLLTLIIGSWESIQATVVSHLLSLRVRPGYEAWGGSAIR